MQHFPVPSVPSYDVESILGHAQQPLNAVHQTIAPGGFGDVTMPSRGRHEDRSTPALMRTPGARLSQGDQRDAPTLGRPTMNGYGLLMLGVGEASADPEPSCW